MNNTNKEKLFKLSTLAFCLAVLASMPSHILIGNR